MSVKDADYRWAGTSEASLSPVERNQFTVIVVFAVTAPLLVVTVAVMVTCCPPPVTRVATPLLLMVAMEVLLLVHCTTLVRFWVVPSEKVPLAVNCWVPCVCATLGFVGEMVRPPDCKVAVLTISEAVAEPLPELAVIVVVPLATAVATPAFETVATDVFEEDHLAVEVTSCVVPFTVVPVAV